ncbi:hypothetical protein IEQ34_010174 [Dendrobium chrysotoxum]|uniref:Uncharacterized protein n=1 Tax=Dendrobium chrysotoxum TaxID=161865 RepID=A0AAV7GLE3_DENCH|nr:hypothetical protein IEQ34_010174 [Dendrobium chrysotoxum]
MGGKLCMGESHEHMRNLIFSENWREVRGFCIRRRSVSCGGGLFSWSCAWVGYKYRMPDLANENSNMHEECESLAVQMASINSTLLYKAASTSLDSCPHIHGFFQNSSSFDH